MPTAVRVFHPRPPYDFALSASYATGHAERSAADTFADGVFRRGLSVGGEIVALSARSLGCVERPSLEIRVEGARLSAEDEGAAVATAARLVGAHVDLAPFYASLSPDDPAADFARRFRGLGLPQSATPFESLILAILGQQISNSVARTLRDLFVDTLGTSVEVGGARYAVFPDAETVARESVDALRRIKLSARKAEYIRGIAERVADGTLDLESLAPLPSDELSARLMELRGVGAWTARWMLLRAYDRRDAFPHGDLAIQRALGELFGLGERLSAREALKLSERWIPHRSLLTTYLFAAIRAQRMGEPMRRAP